MNVEEMKETIEYQKYKKTLKLLLCFGIFVAIIEIISFTLIIYQSNSLPSEYRNIIISLVAILQSSIMIIYLLMLRKICVKMQALLLEAKDYIILDGKVLVENEKPIGKYTYVIEFIYNDK